MEDLISIIVAVYNAKWYLEKCVNSLINQTYRNLEIILVDDVSTDNSGEICDDFQKKDERIKVIHKENGGHADARNAGIKASKGNYIFFVDNDDYIDSDLIECLYKRAKQCNAEIVACGYIKETYYSNKIEYAKENYIADSEEMIRRMLQYDDVSLALWDKLYKRELFEDIELPKDIVYDEVSSLYRLFDRAKIIAHIDKAGYHYVQRAGSILHKKFNKEKLCIIDLSEKILEFVTKKYPKIICEAESFLIINLNKAIIECYKNKFKKEYKQFKNKSKEYISRTLKNPKIKLKTKLKNILITYFGFARVFK